MSKLTIVANIIAKKKEISAVKAELLKLIEPTKAENGCIQYDLHQDNKNPAHFMFYENWESHELWQEHKNSSHLKNFATQIEDLIDGFIVNEMTILK